MNPNHPYCFLGKEGLSWEDKSALYDKYEESRTEFKSIFTKAQIYYSEERKFLNQIEERYGSYAADVVAGVIANIKRAVAKKDMGYADHPIIKFISSNEWDKAYAEISELPFVMVQDQKQKCQVRGVDGQPEDKYILVAYIDTGLYDPVFHINPDSIDNMLRDIEVRKKFMDTHK